MSDLRRALRLHGWAQTVLWGMVAALVVDLAGLSRVRADLTRDGRYGLSDAAVASVSDLERPLLARVWFSTDLEAPYHDHRQVLLDLLDELAARSGGRLLVEAVDPTGDPALQEAASRRGVRPIPYAFRDRDRAETRAVWMGLTLDYGERSVAIGALPSVPRMEEQVVAAILGLIADPAARPTLGWWVGHGEPDPAQAAGPVATLLERLGERVRVRRFEGPIPEDVDQLLIAAPRSPFGDADLAELDRFVGRGGAVLAFVSSVQPDFAAGRTVAIRHGLGDWLRGVGAPLGAGLLLDRVANEALVVPVQLPGRAPARVRVNHPLAPVTTALVREVPAVRDLPRLVLPFATPVGLADPLPDGVEGEVWAWSGPGSSAWPGPASLDPSWFAEPRPGEVQGPFPVVVALSGTFPVAGARSAPTRMVVVGSGDALANDLDLVLDAVDWLAGDTALIGLRSRAAGDPPLVAPPRGSALAWKAGMVGVPAAALGVVGLLVALRRRR